MTEEILKKAVTIKATESILTEWIDSEKNKEIKLDSCYGYAGAFPDETYLINVKKEIKSATIKILKKHQAIKEKELAAIK